MSDPTDAPTPDPRLLAAALDARESRPWMFYRFDHDELKKWLNAVADERDKLRADAAASRAPSQEITGATSDGYHTFDGLYAYRKAFNALLFNQWATLGLYDVHKSRLHSDGLPCFGGGWFIVVAQTPEGQVSNHYEEADWDLFQIPARDRSAEYDGHTPQVALERMLRLAAGARAVPSVDVNALIALMADLRIRRDEWKADPTVSDNQTIAADVWAKEVEHILKPFESACAVPETPPCIDCGRAVEASPFQRCETCWERVFWRKHPRLAVSETQEENMKLSLHRCKVCGARWLHWPDEINHGGWNLLDKYQRSGSCCDNAAMGEQIEHLRDFDLGPAVPVQDALTTLPQRLRQIAEDAFDQPSNTDLRVRKAD